MPRSDDHLVAAYLNDGDEHAWLLEFCDSCRRCIRDCPPGAFYDEPVHHDNGLVTVLDNDRCFPYFLTYHGCSVCIKVCPFNTNGYDQIKAGFRPEPERGAPDHQPAREEHHDH